MSPKTFCCFVTIWLSACFVFYFFYYAINHNEIISAICSLPFTILLDACLVMIKKDESN